jgi:hypothetical protein
MERSSQSLRCKRACLPSSHGLGRPCPRDPCGCGAAAPRGLQARRRCVCIRAPPVPVLVRMGSRCSHERHAVPIALGQQSGTCHMRPMRRMRPCFGSMAHMTRPGGRFGYIELASDQTLVAAKVRQPCLPPGGEHGAAPRP